MICFHLFFHPLKNHWIIIHFTLFLHFSFSLLLRIMENFKSFYFHSTLSLNLKPFCSKSLFLILILGLLKVLILKLKYMKKLILFNFWYHFIIEFDMCCYCVRVDWIQQNLINFEVLHYLKLTFFHHFG